MPSIETRSEDIIYNNYEELVDHPWKHVLLEMLPDGFVDGIEVVDAVREGRFQT